MSDAPQSIPRARLRFAVLCDADTLERWQTATIRELIAHGNADPVVIVAAARRTNGAAAAAGIFRSLLRPLEREASDSIDDFCQSVGASPSCDALATLEVDFILYLGFGSCDANLARCAKHGLWRFRFGDVSKHANYPPGVWEIIAGDPLTAAALCRQHADARGLTVLRSGVFATISHRANANADQVLAEISHWPAYVARNLYLGHVSGDGATIDVKKIPEPTFPSLGVRLRLAWTLFSNRIARLPNLFFEDQWNVGIVEEPIHRFLQPDLRWAASWFPNRDKRRYFADPMGADIDGKRVVLCEIYDDATQLGSLCSLGIDDHGWLPTVSATIPTGVHASYPYLVKVGESLYCIPETSQARTAVLYKLTKFPDEYRPVKPLVSEFACIDPTLFEHDGRWWLFCTDATDGEHTKLLAWYAKDLLDAFVPHPLNPLKIDVRSARPAGTPFYHEGKLFRPSQDCSRTYGGAVTISEITMLSPTSFQERAVSTVKPDPKSGYGFGLHTLSNFGDATLIDSKRRIITGRGLREKCGSVLARLLPNRTSQ